MKHNFLKLSSIILFAGAVSISCVKEEQATGSSDGPSVTIVEVPESALMGDTLPYKVKIEDETALSTLEVKLLFDETVVASESIRTKEAGEYEGSLEIPFLKDIPDGTATLCFVATNTALGKTDIDHNVAVSRPVFEYLTLKTEDGNEYKMEKTETAHLYSVEDNFPSALNAKIETPAFGTAGKTLTFAWNVSEIAVGDYSYIPFAGDASSKYTVSINTLTFQGAPFTEHSVNEVSAKIDEAETAHKNYSTVVNLKQNGEVKVVSNQLDFTDWVIDPDFLETTGTPGTYKFLAVDGLYKVIFETEKKFFRIERMDSEIATGTYEVSGAVWMIGNDFGKPISSGHSWWTDDSYCFAEVSKGVHQMTLVAGTQIKTGAIDMKIFHQAGWGGEFGAGALSTDSDLIVLNEESGNIALAEGKTLDLGGIYRFTLDVTAAVLHFEKVGQNEVESKDVKVNGATLTDDGSAYIGVASFKKGEDISVSGLDDISEYYIDPDFVNGQTFKAADGDYKVTLYHVGHKYATFSKMKDATTTATIDEHALWLMGWGVATPVMNKQIGFDEGKAYAMAEVEDMVFEFTGTAVSDEKDDTTIGGRFRTDYLSFKYFGQNGWGREKGKILDESVTTTVQLTERAAALIKDAGNFELADGVNLEAGATYVLRIDLSKTASEGIETVDFYKK